MTHDVHRVDEDLSVNTHRDDLPLRFLGTLGLMWCGDVNRRFLPVSLQ